MGDSLLRIPYILRLLVRRLIQFGGIIMKKAASEDLPTDFVSNGINRPVRPITRFRSKTLEFVRKAFPPQCVEGRE